MEGTITADIAYPPPPGWRPADWAAVPLAERCIRWLEHNAGGRAMRYPRPTGTDHLGRVYARLNHNRWIVECPCGSAQITSPDDPRFWCMECSNSGSGLWLAVVWPDAGELAALAADLVIEAPAARNWAHPDDPSAAAALTRAATRNRR